MARKALSKSPNIKRLSDVALKIILLPENGDPSETIFPLLEVQASDQMKMGPLELNHYPSCGSKISLLSVKAIVTVLLR